MTKYNISFFGVLFTIMSLVSKGQVPSTNQNYIVESVLRHGYKNLSEIKNKPVDSVNRMVQYFDGLGRPVQRVQWQGSPGKKDIVQHIEYDGFGRESHQYLPYAEQAGNDGSFRPGARLSQMDYYSTAGWDGHVKKTDYPYAVTVFENSPLNRVLEQGAPGAAWQPVPNRGAATSTGRTVVTEYGTNAASDVLLWNVTATGANGTGYYQPRKLYMIAVKDENWTAANGKGGRVDEYRDFDNRVVLKRVWESDSKALHTYYVYDDFGNLRYVLPPGYTATTVDDNSADFNELVYAYRYDGRGRLIEKKIPGKGWEHIVYNRNDQPVLMQDAVQRVSDTWSYVKYDAFGRVTETGIFSKALSRSALQDTLNAEPLVPGTALWDTRGYNGQAYDNKSYPRQETAKTILQVNYYDDYGFKHADTLPAGTGLDSTSRVSTLLTGTKVYRVDGTGPVLSVNYYDKRGRLIQVASQNHLGGTDYVTNTYNFRGELLTSKREHKPSPVGATTTLLTMQVYDHTGRLAETRKKVNAQAEVVQNRLAYSEIGQLKEKKLHSTTNGASFLTTISYGYNERGWITNIGSSRFTGELRYELPATGGIAQYNGNISQQLWGYGAITGSTFSYTYDMLNRLTNGTSTGTVMSEVLTYDDRGNISTLKRDNGTPVAYSYSNSNKSNRLAGLSGGLTGSYTYDANGNATLNHMGMVFTYNHLNLPQTAVKAGTSVAYLYDARGTKLRKTATVSSITTQRDYIGSIEYSKTGSGASAIERIATEEGYLQNSSGTYSYYYNITDHLGNTRVVVSEAGTVLQETDYYPFGLPVEIFAGVQNNYLYQGKELQRELTQYDFGARFYDPQIGRWHVVDPLTEVSRRWSPYNYAYNNPIRFIDPDGMEADNWVKRGNRWSYDPNITTRKQAIEAGADDFRENGSTIENAKIGEDGRVGAVYLGYSAKDVAYSENNFTNWNAVHEGEYENRTEAYRAWQSDPGYHKGEGFWDRTFRVMAYGSMEARRDYASGGMNMYGGYGKAAQAAEKLFTVNPSKFDYFFGRVVTGAEHNITRSADNLRDLTQLGITTKAELITVFNQAIKSGTVVSTKTTQYGTTIMRSVTVGDKGSVSVGFFYQGGNTSATPSVTTIIPKIFK